MTEKGLKGLPVFVEEKNEAPERYEDHSGELAHFESPWNVRNVI